MHETYTPASHGHSDRIGFYAVAIPILYNTVKLTAIGGGPHSCGVSSGGDRGLCEFAVLGILDIPLIGQIVTLGFKGDTNQSSVLSTGIFLTAQ